MSDPQQAVRMGSRIAAAGRRWFVAAALLSALHAEAHDFGDDYGDTPESGMPVIPNTSRSGRIEIDGDEDWFLFHASSLKRYTITVTTGTLWDASADVRLTDTVTQRGATSSVPVAPASVTFVHAEPLTLHYVRVTGFAHFTTGTYTVAVSEANLTDGDGDTMEDGWEIATFGSTNHPAGEDADGDGLDNGEEFRVGSSPTNSLSGFAITVFQAGAGNVSLRFGAQPFRRYAVSSCTNLLTHEWQSVGLLESADAATELVFGAAQAPGEKTRFYRVDCVVADPSVGSAAFEGAADTGGGWKWLEWFGFFTDLGSGWIWHLQHDSMYGIGPSPDCVWLWTSDMGWLWTSDTTYPNIYRVQDDAWLWYQEESDSPRWFYNYKTSSWEAR